MKRPLQAGSRGYRVDLLINMTGTYAPYTAPKRGVERTMADSYASHLKRGLSGGRIVDLATGEVIEVWESQRRLTAEHKRCPFPTKPRAEQVWCDICHRWTDN